MATTDGAAWRPLTPYDDDGLPKSTASPAIEGRHGSAGEQAVEVDVKKREALLRRIQQLMHERAMFAPIVEPAFLSGHGPRLEQSGFGLIAGIPYTLPYEEIRLKPGRS